MDQDVTPVVPVSLEFNGVRVTLSMPEAVPLNPKRARTTITPKLDLTEAPPIPAVPAASKTSMPVRDVTLESGVLCVGESRFASYAKVRAIFDLMNYSVVHRGGNAIDVINQVYRILGVVQPVGNATIETATWNAYTILKNLDDSKFKTFVLEATADDFAGLLRKISDAALQHANTATCMAIFRLRAEYLDVVSRDLEIGDLREM